jgi:glycosyltransferase involved in cell wall biosynthesis
VRRRIAFIDYFATHYRKRLYEELASRMEADFYFFADEREHFWNRRIPLVQGGDFRRMDRRRFRIAGEPLMPGLVADINARRYDAVIKSLNGRLMLPLVYGASRARGVPFVLWTGMWHHPRTTAHRVSKPLTEAIYRTAEAIVVYGEHVKRFVLDSADLDPAKVFVAGQAVDPERFEAVQPSRGGPTEILFVGQFEERKGLADLMDAFAGLADPGARLRLVGNGSLQDEIDSRAAVDPRVEVVGYLPQEALPEQLGRARCLVLPSITTATQREPWGLVVNEAMHAGLPVVVTETVGAAAGGLVQDGRNGFVVPERDAIALRHALSRFATEPELAARLGDQARRDVARFSHSAMADAFEAAVEYAIAVSSASDSRGRCGYEAARQKSACPGLPNDPRYPS